MGLKQVAHKMLERIRVRLASLGGKSTPKVAQLVTKLQNHPSTMKPDI
jgi:hypothetical protein